MVPGSIPAASTITVWNYLAFLALSIQTLNLIPGDRSGR
jgi:hypothetical protein